MELREALKGRAPADSRFEPPWSTLQVGRLAGGVAHNVIPGHASVDWELRPVSDADQRFVCEAIGAFARDDLLPAMREISPDADIVTHVIGEVCGLEPVDDNEARRIVSALTGANCADVVAFGTEAGLFQRLGMSVVVCGPGSIAQAHKPDEFIEIAQLSSCLDMLQGLAGQLCVNR
jgi:acetylornithine deacetylase